MNQQRAETRALFNLLTFLHGVTFIYRLLLLSVVSIDCSHTDGAAFDLLRQCGVIDTFAILIH
ncbi:hypothetical protein GCM10011297_29750 [Bacterioplanes sanyensis]|nr:hypothetical protein GCM10011297_29750 [Bacterioplanes sanyensis]